MAAPISPAAVARLHLANPTQRELIQYEIRVTEGALQGHSMFVGDPETASADMRTWRGTNFTQPDAAILRESLKRDKETYAKAIPPEINNFQKNKLWELCQAEEEKYREGLLTYDQMRDASPTNVQQYTAHKAYNETRAQFIINTHRIVDQDAEFSLEYLRENGGQRKSRFPWEIGYQKITWTPEEELEDALATMDDSVYLQFLHLRLAGVETPGLIQEKLHLSKATYEACVRRLAQSEEAAVTLAQEPAAPAIQTNGHAAPQTSERPALLLADLRRLRRYLETHPDDQDMQAIQRRFKWSKNRFALALKTLQAETVQTAAHVAV